MAMHTQVVQQFSLKLASTARIQSSGPQLIEVDPAELPLVWHAQVRIVRERRRAPHERGLRVVRGSALRLHPQPRYLATPKDAVRRVFRVDAAFVDLSGVRGRSTRRRERRQIPPLRYRVTAGVRAAHARLCAERVRIKYVLAQERLERRLVHDGGGVTAENLCARCAVLREVLAVLLYHVPLPREIEQLGVKHAVIGGLQ